MARLLDSPWASGAAAIAEAFAQAPTNRARVRQMELEAANAAADNELKRLKYDQEVAKAKQDQLNWAAEQRIRDAAEGRAVDLHSSTVAKSKAEADSAGIEAAFAPVRNADTHATSAEALRHAKANNPYLEDQSKAQAAEATMKAGLEEERIANKDILAGSITDEVYRNIQSKKPVFNIKDSLQPAAFGNVGVGSYSGGEYVPAEPITGSMDLGRGYTSDLDRVSEDMALEDRIRSQADTAVLSPTLDQAKWITDTTAAMGGKIAGSGSRPATPQEIQDLNLPDYASVSMDSDNKPTVLSNEKPKSYRAATTQEKMSLGLPPETPLVFDQDDNPKILSDGKSVTNINNNPNGAAGNVPENKFADIFDKQFETANTTGKAIESITTAEAALDGAITGARAGDRLGLQKLGAWLGVADPQAIVDTETFSAAVKPVVAAVLRQSVGSTQISDADRRFAEDAAAGNIELNETSIRNLLRIMRANYSRDIRAYNQRVDAVYPDDGAHTRERGAFMVPQDNTWYAYPIGPLQNPEDQFPGFDNPNPAAPASTAPAPPPAGQAPVLDHSNTSTDELLRRAKQFIHQRQQLGGR